MEDKKERSEFTGALHYLLSHIPLTCDVDGLLKERWWFAEWSVGCIGILRDWLVETVAALLAEGHTTLTREALQAHALQPGQRVRLEMEARAGEQRVEKGKAATQQQLEELNGPTVPLPRKPVASSSRIGERAPQRDPVGESENLTNPLPPSKCPVSNQMVDLDFHLFTQSAVVHVECPMCGSVRKGTLKKNQITFPYHEKLRSRSTHPGPRWLKHEEEWRISSPAS
jgi:hypothetical protein